MQLSGEVQVFNLRKNTCLGIGIRLWFPLLPSKERLCCLLKVVLTCMCYLVYSRFLLHDTQMQYAIRQTVPPQLTMKSAALFLDAACIDNIISGLFIDEAATDNIPSCLRPDCSFRRSGKGKAKPSMPRGTVMIQNIKIVICPRSSSIKSSRELSCTRSEAYQYGR